MAIALSAASKYEPDRSSHARLVYPRAEGGNQGMSRGEIEPTTPEGSFARAVFLLGACLTTGTGIGLFAVPGRTAEYWAWTIKAPLSAAFFGAGYIGAAIALWAALREREWRRARIVAVL